MLLLGGTFLKATLSRAVSANQGEQQYCVHIIVGVTVKPTGSSDVVLSFTIAFSLDLQVGIGVQELRLTPQDPLAEMLQGHFGCTFYHEIARHLVGCQCGCLLLV